MNSNAETMCFELFRESAGDFFIEIDNFGPTGPFHTFDEAQEALNILVNDAVKGGIQRGQKVGIKRLVLMAIPS